MWDTRGEVVPEVEAEIAKVCGSTTLEQFGRLLLKIGKKGVLLELPTYVGDYFSVYDSNQEHSVLNSESPLTDVCRAITALKYSLRVLAGYRPRGTEIEELHRQLEEIQERLNELE